MSVRDLFFALTAYFGSFVILVVVVFPPIGNWILLHAHFTADEIERGNLRVAQVIGNQEILFSNGERRPFEGRTKALRAAVFVGLAALDFALVSWALARWHRQLISPESAE